MSFLSDLYRDHGNDVQQHLSDQLGLTPEQAAAVLPKVAPLILGGIKQRMDTHGAGHVEEHVNRVGAPDLSDIGALLRGGGEAHDDDLGGLLGGQGPQTSQMLGQQLGISAGTAAKLIPMVAPLIIGLLMKKGSQAQSSGGGSVMDGIGGLLGGGAGKSGCLSSLLGGLLNRKR